MIDLNELCKLNQFRDTYVEGTGKYREVEIENEVVGKTGVATDPHLYPTYRKVKVLDGALVKEKGIVDELFRKCFELMSVEIKTEGVLEVSNGKYERVGNAQKLMLGAYLNHRKIGTKMSAWDTYFKAAGGIWIRNLGGIISDCDKEGKFFEGVTQGFEQLVKFSEGKYNGKISGIEIADIDSFKRVLLDSELSSGVVNYLLGVVANNTRRFATKGKHVDYYLKSNNGKKETIYNYFLSLDKPSKKDGGNEYYSFVKVKEEDEFGRPDDILDNILDDIRNENNGVNELYSFMNHRAKKVLSNALYRYFQKRVKGEIKSDPHYNKAIIQVFEEYFKQHKWLINNKGKWEYKKDTIATIEDILIQENKQKSFIKLCEYIKHNNIASEILVDCIYNLDKDKYIPITAYINNKSMDMNYIDNKFDVVLEALQSIYNEHSKSNKELVNYPKNSVEMRVFKFKKFMNDEVMKGDTRVFISRHNELNLMSRDEIKAQLEKLFDKKMTVPEFSKTMLKLGYDMRATTKLVGDRSVLGFLLEEVNENTKVKPKVEVNKIELNEDIKNKVRYFINKNNGDGYIVKTKSGTPSLTFIKFNEFLIGLGIKSNVNQKIEIIKDCGYEITKFRSITIEGKESKACFIKYV